MSSNWQLLYSSVMIIFSRREAPSQARLQPSPRCPPRVSFLLPAQVLAGLLHLGNILFADSEDEAQPCQLMDNAKCESKGGGSCASGSGRIPREQGRSCSERGRYWGDWVGGQRVKFGIDALD